MYLINKEDIPLVQIGGAGEIAGRSRGTPRIANRMLKRVRDFAQVLGDGTISKSLADTPNPFQHPVRNPRRPPAPSRYFTCPLPVNRDMQESSGAGDDEGQLLLRIEFQPEGDSEPIP